MAIEKQEGRVIDWTNGTGSDVSVNSMVDLTSRVGVAMSDIANGDTGAVKLVGVFEETAATADAIAVGDLLYWDGSALTKTATDNTPAGMAVSAKTAAVAGSVDVRIG